MPLQGWLVHGSSRLCRVHHIPTILYPAGAAILFAGFSHPMCDVDYFMSRLARVLCARGYFVAQVDPRGHGDSSGDLAEIDLDTLREDIAAAIACYSDSVSDNLVLIGRGLAATLIAEFTDDVRVRAVAGVAPYQLAADMVRRYSAQRAADSDYATAWLPGQDYVHHSDFPPDAVSILDGLGAVAYNLHGGRISPRLFAQLGAHDAAAALQRAGQDQHLWLSEPFRRDPAFQRTLFDRLGTWAASGAA